MPDTQYPQVISKVDPLIIRVNELILLVGSTSYSAKIKQGSIYNGFYIYTSSLGEPIDKVEVDSSSFSNENIAGVGSDAYNHIKSKAIEWIDTLQDSFTKATSQKNTVELLKEIKCQLHYDITGDNSLFEEGMDVDMSSTSLSQKLTDTAGELKNLNTKLNALNTKMDNLNTNISTVSTKTEMVANRLASSETTLGTMVCDAVDAALQSIMGQFNDINTFLETSIGTLPDDGISLHNYMRDLDSDIGSIYASVGPADTSPYNTTIQAYLRNIVYPPVSTINQTLSSVGTVYKMINGIKTSVGDSPDSSTIHTFLRTINNNVDAEAESIRSAMGGIGQGNASSSEVGAIKSVVDSIDNVVRTLSVGNINYTADRLCQDGVVDMLWDAIMPINDSSGNRVSGYIQTEVTRDEYAS